MEENDQATNVAEGEIPNTKDIKEVFVASSSGIELVTPGVMDLPNLPEINAQFNNHAAFWDTETPAQTKMCLATKQCPHPSHFRRHTRNQHGFTIHSANCNCRLLFAKRYQERGARTETPSLFKEPRRMTRRQ